ncbi:hypothetical protein [Paraburkholderia sediminicola]|uniref:hypothetical protein n=1 Tax=Paraburkholderia sediminicola TaxID=458836 RepID=UPI0038B82F4C
MWGAMIQMGQQAATGMAKAELQNATNAANYTLDKANVDASNLLATTNADNANMLRYAGNGFLIAQANLANTQRSIGNNQKADAIGSQYGNQQTNIQRQFDSMNRGSLEQQINNAATLGAMQADASARGVGGGSAAIMRNTMLQTQGRQRTQQADKQASMTFDAHLASVGIMRNMVFSQDQSQTVANLDYGVNIAQTQLEPMKPISTDPSDAAIQGMFGVDLSQFVTKTTKSSSSGQPAGGVGDTSGYSSQAILNGVNSVGSNWSGSNNWGVGGNDYGFKADVGGETNGFFASSGSDFKFTLD